MESHHQAQHSHSHPQSLAGSESSPPQQGDRQHQHSQEDSRGQQQTQTPSQTPSQTQQSPPPHAQRGGKRPGRTRGSGSSSRGRRPSSASSSVNHHNDSNPDNVPGPASMTNILNFGDAPQPPPPASIHARTPAGRGRGKNASSHSHSHSHSRSRTSSSPIPEAVSSSATPNMDFAPRSERAPKQGLGHSFTFSTPQPNAGKPGGRKRARTLEYPTAPDTAADDAAKVKGGHSLRKRARIDYAQMAEDDDHIYSPAADEPQPQEITVSGARAVRKRRPAADVNHEEQEDQSHPPTVLSKKRAPRADKQRTASPVPQRRPYTKRKSIVPAAAPVEEPSPEQQPSDTELKDTIEVGAPLAMQFTSSSSNGQPSETASNGSGQSPEHHGNGPQAVTSRAEVTSPTSMRPRSEVSAKASTGKALDSEENAPDDANQPGADAKVDGEEKASVPTNQVDSSVVGQVNNHSPAIVDSLQDDKPDMNGNSTKMEEQPPPDHNSNHDAEPSQAASPLASHAAESGANADIPKEEPKQSLHDNSTTLDLSQLSEPSSQPSSQEATDSDATEVVPPSVTRPRVASVEAEQPPAPSQHTRLTLRKSKQAAPTSVPAVDSQQPEEMDGTQDSQKPSLRPRRRLTRNAEASAAAVEEPLRSPKEKPPSASKKVDGRTKASRAAVAQENPQPTSPETPKKRGPGRPPKIRQSIEQEPQKPKERRASRNVTRIEQPRPVRSHAPRDFSFLDPYLKDAREMYPEISQNSGVPTPLETPTLQASDAADEQGEDIGSLAPEKESASQDPHLGTEGDSGSSAPTPAAVSDMLTPAPESAAPSRNPSPEPVVESMRKPKPRKQYSFPRIRSPTEFAAILDEHKAMSDEDLYSILEVSTKALSAWKDEWKVQKLITEDEDNAVRRRAHDAALMAREARDLAKTNGSVTMEKRDFEVKGLRADRANENKHLYPQSNPEAYERYQDQIAAQSWGFEWDPRPSMIARQDPIAQRDGLQNTRLRNRPKLSQRAAEAAGDEPVGIVPGKRTRKPRVMSDQSQEPSRAPTPVEQPARRRRRKRNVDGLLVDSDNEGPPQPPASPPPPVAVPDAPPKKKRGPKPKAVKEAEARAAAEREAAERAAQEAASAAENAEAGMDGDQPMTRKRRRGAAAASSYIQPHDIPTASIEDGQSQASSGQRQVAQEEPPPKRRRGRKPKIEAPTATFYSTASSVPTHDGTNAPIEEVARPSTSSSTSSMRTVESSYSFRNRTRKNYSELADPIKDVLAEPRPRRARKPKNQHQDPEPTSYPSNLAPAPFPDGPQFSPAPRGYQPQQASVLAPPNTDNNPFINITGGGPGPGPLLAPSPMRAAPPPPSVGANPFHAPMNSNPVEPVPHPQRAPSPLRRKPIKIRIVNSKNRNQSATPQPAAGPHALRAQAAPGLQQHHQPFAPGPTSLQPPSNFHGHIGFEPHIFGGPPPLPPSIPGAGPGQAMFPVNASPSGAMAMSMPPMSSNAPPPQLQQQYLPGAGGRPESLPPDSGRATPVPSSGASVGDEALSEKDYASMTKSEKMSASMKARWANGSMRQAVNKRKETLARKKQKQTDDKTTPTPTPESMPPEERPRVPSNPVLPPPSASTLHEAGGPIPRASQQQIPHGMGGVLHLVGGHDAHPPVSHGSVVLPAPLSLPPQQQAMPGPPVYDNEYRSPHHSLVQGYPDSAAAPAPAERNPFLDNGYADLHARLPFSHLDGLNEGRGRQEQERGGHGRGWGPGPGPQG